MATTPCNHEASGYVYHAMVSPVPSTYIRRKALFANKIFLKIHIIIKVMHILKSEETKK